MSINFQANDPSLESQWRSIILFGKNSATYKFAFAKSLLEIVEQEKNRVTLEELSIPFANYIVEHLRKNDKQGNAAGSTFLAGCRKFINNQITQDELYSLTQKYGFVNVVDAFQNVNGGKIPNLFYEKNFDKAKKGIVINDNLLKIKDLFQYRNLNQEVEARWSLVETAWGLNINPNLLEVQYDVDDSLLFVNNRFMKRINITSVRDSLNGYQKGKCFFSLQDISISANHPDICDVDHFFPHVHKLQHAKANANLNGVWNLILTQSSLNRVKGTRIPEIRFLERLFNRNEYYIESNLPLAETIINQTGPTKAARMKFLQDQYDLAVSLSIQKWRPENELPGTF